MGQRNDFLKTLARKTYIRTNKKDEYTNRDKSLPRKNETLFSSNPSFFADFSNALQGLPPASKFI